jgi:hypothetical protein
VPRPLLYMKRLEGFSTGSPMYGIERAYMYPSPGEIYLVVQRRSCNPRLLNMAIFRVMSRSRQDAIVSAMLGYRLNSPEYVHVGCKASTFRNAHTTSTECWINQPPYSPNSLRIPSIKLKRQPPRPPCQLPNPLPQALYVDKIGQTKLQVEAKFGY